MLGYVREGNRMKKIATIEARMTSTRLPGKVLMEACGKPMLELMVERVRRSALLDDVVVATTTNKEDDKVVEMCDRIGCMYYRGSETDVLLRVLEAAQSVSADVIVELTGDCPCIDWRHIDYLLKYYLEHDYDFVANNTEQTFPDGFDIRIFSTKELAGVNAATKDLKDHEHVSIYFPNNQDKFRCYNWVADTWENRPGYAVTLDEKGDYELIKRIFEALYPNDPDFKCSDVIKFIDEHQDLLQYVKDIKRTQL